jgi:RND family efflux transporter MFP subunit
VTLLDKGDPVTVRLDSMPDRDFPGSISRTAYAEEPANRTLRAEIDLDNTDGLLRPGQFGIAIIIVEDLGKRLSVPNFALSDFNQKKEATCYRLEGGRAVRTRVKIGESADGRTEVVQGLKEGESVIVSGGKISDGQAVETEGVRPSQGN